MNPLWLECWGKGWLWRNCVGRGKLDSKLGEVILSPLSETEIRLSWTAKYINNNKKNNNDNNKVPSSSNLLPNSLEDGGEDSQFYQEDNMNYNLESSGEQTYMVVRIPSGASHVIENVTPKRMYQILLQPPMSANKTSIYFKLHDNFTSSSGLGISGDGSTVSKNYKASENTYMRVEEIGLLVLVLILWIIAIVLFVHRWGKIRMLEPYQPMYKPISAPATPLGSTTALGSCSRLYMGGPIVPSTYRGPPLKSSSLCFTPSVYQTMPSYRGVLTHQQSVASRHSCPASSRFSIRHHQAARAFKIRSDTITQYSGKTLTKYHHHYCRKARSAENLRNSRMSFNCSIEDPRETRSSSSLIFNSGFGLKNLNGEKSKELAGPPVHHLHHHNLPGGSVKYKWNKCVNSSLESCRGASLPISQLDSKTPLLLEAGFRGHSLDSACYARRLADGRVTPELRVSPPPPSPKDYQTIAITSPRRKPNKSYFNYMNMYSPSQKMGSETPTLARSPSGFSHGRLGLQRQEPIEETLFPPHYPTVVEEEPEEELICSLSEERSFDTSYQVVNESITPKRGILSSIAHVISPPIAEQEHSTVADSKEEEDDRNLPGFSYLPRTKKGASSTSGSSNLPESPNVSSYQHSDVPVSSNLPESSSSCSNVPGCSSGSTSKPLTKSSHKLQKSSALDTEV